MSFKYEGISIPGGFGFPSSKQFSEYTTAALSHIGFDSEFTRANLTNPMQSQVNALIVAVESAASKPIKEISKVLSSVGASASMVSKLSGDVVSLIYNLVEGNIEVAVKTAVNLAVSAASSAVKSIGGAFASAMASVIPVVGQMVSMAIDAVMMFTSGEWSEERKEASAEAAKNELTQKLDQLCPKITGTFDPIATSPTGATPADLFRGVFVAAQLGQPIPPTLASLYVLLCGGESQSVGMTRRESSLWLNKTRKELGPSIGIPYHVQRRMWSTIKAIMFSCKDPRLGGPLVAHGDQGRSAYALLQDLVYNEFRAGHWTIESARSLSGVLGSRDEFSWSYDCGANCSGVVRSSCRDHFYLEYALQQAQRSWQGVLEEKFCDPSKAPPPGQDCYWRSIPSPAELDKLNQRKKKGLLVMSSAQVKALVSAGVKAELQADEQQGDNKKMLFAAGAVVLGAVGFLGVRRTVKKRARS